MSPGRESGVGVSWVLRRVTIYGYGTTYGYGTRSGTSTYNIYSKYGSVSTGTPYILSRLFFDMRIMSQTVLQTKSAAIRTPKKPP